MKLCLSLVFLFSGFAHAESLLGHWRMTNRECASGAPSFENFGKGSYQLDADAQFTATELTTHYRVAFRMDQREADRLLKKLRLDSEKAQFIPDVYKRAKILERIQASIKEIEEIKVGRHCEGHFVNEYKDLGDAVHIGRTLRWDTTCEDAALSANDATGHDDKLEFRGGKLRITDSAAETDRGTCPTGDHVVSVFERVL